MKRLFFLATALAFLAVGCSETGNSTESSDPPATPAPPNIILLIGDGMGLSQVSAAYYYGEKEPSFSRFQHIGLMNTSPSDKKITDSAAGATAFACGIKSYNGAIAVDTAKQAVPTILEELAEAGWRTGVVATSSITHATPASFYAHVEKRSLAEDIAVQMVDSPVDFFAGGGRQFFAKRTDGRNLLPELEAKGFQVDTNAIPAALEGNASRYGFLLADDGMMPMPAGRGDFLSQATNRALEHLSAGDSPYFLMVEGSQIDWGGHANNADYLIQELLDFDQVVGEVLDFAEADGNTLVIVTADHETGGFTLAAEEKKADDGDLYDDYGTIEPTFSTGGHSTTLIPVFAKGPGSDLFLGVYENTKIYDLMKEVSGQ